MENIISIGEFNELTKPEQGEYIGLMAKEFAPKLMNGEYIDCSTMFTHPEPENWEDYVPDVPDYPVMEYVDLDLPSGTLWAKYNVGSTSENDFGLLFAWGETCGYTASQIGVDKNFADGAGTHENDYIFGPFNGKNEGYEYSKYNLTDGKTVLDTEDDAATAMYGEDCCIPTMKQNEELFSNTNKYFYYDSNNNVVGAKFTSVYDENKYIVIPWCGGGVYDGIDNTNDGNYAALMSNEIYSFAPQREIQFNYGFYCAFAFRDNGEGGIEPFENGNVNIRRCYGMPIRPVKKTDINMPEPLIPIKEPVQK